MEEYLPWATERERQFVEAWKQNDGNATRAAEQLGLTPTAVRASFARLRRRAALAGFSPEHDLDHPAPDTHFLRDITIHRDSEGNVVQTWAKLHAKQQELVRQAEQLAESVAERIKPADPIEQPKYTDSQLLTLYPIADLHIGLYSWADETGNDYDTTIATRLLHGCSSRLIGSSPPATNAIVANLGDFFHMDSPANQTERSGHRLDADTRWARVVDVGIQGLLGTIDFALQKHRFVDVKNELGNHDPQSSLLMSLVLRAHYRNEPRVRIDCNPSKFSYYAHGLTLLGFTHGDTVKMPQLSGQMLADVPDLAGKARFRHWWTGHIHHKQFLELKDCTVESCRTMAALDAYAHSHGYRSLREMQCVVYHDKYDEVERHRVGVESIGESDGTQS